jgi:probable HAF family extracellular repeat protein
MTDIGTLPAPFNHNAVGQYVNDNGDVVGYSQKTGGGTDSFLYTNGVMYDMKDLILTTPGYTLSGIGDINDSGQIVASAYTPGNELDAVLLTPVPEPASFVPVLLTGALLRRWGRDRDRGIKRGRCD